MITKRDLVKSGSKLFDRLKEDGFVKKQVKSFRRGIYGVNFEIEKNDRLYKFAYQVDDCDDYLEVHVPDMEIGYNDLYEHLAKALPDIGSQKQYSIKRRAENITRLEGVEIGITSRYVPIAPYIVYSIEELEEVLLSYVEVYEKELKPWSEEFSDIKRASDFLDEVRAKKIDASRYFEHQSFNNLIILYYMINMLGGSGEFLDLIQKIKPSRFQRQKEDTSVDQEGLQRQIDEYNAIYPKIDAYFKSIGKFVEAKDPEA